LPTKTDPLSKKRSWLLVLYSHWFLVRKVTT
jgi:hypothetical protein